jgi:translocation and assembly module TamA
MVTRRKSSRNPPNLSEHGKATRPSGRAAYVLGNGCRPAITLSCVLLWGAALSASAQDMTLSAPGAGEELVERLRANALLLQDSGDTARTSQDIVSAARADYARLVGTLYQFGHFSPVVRITLDGREAAGFHRFPSRASSGRDHRRTRPGLHVRHRRDRPACRATPSCRRTSARRLRQHARSCATPRSAAIDRWREAGARWRRSRIKASPRATGMQRLMRASPSRPGPSSVSVRLVPQGQTRMRPERIVEIAGLPQGVTFSPEVLDRVAERLRDTGVFSAVALGEQPLGPGDTMDIVATLTESPPRRFGFGAELSTDAGARVSAFWLHRNLFGGAERLRIEGEVRGIGQGELSVDGVDGIDVELRARISRPATFTPDTLAYAEIDIAALDEPTFRTCGSAHRGRGRALVFPQAGRRAGPRPQDNRVRRRAWHPQHDAAVPPDRAELGQSRRPLNPTTGVYMIGTATPFVIMGDGVGARLTADARGYLGLRRGRPHHSGRTRAGLGPVRRRTIDGDPARLPVLFRRLRHGAGAGIPVARRDPERRSIRRAQLRHAVGRGSAILGRSNLGLVLFADAGFVGDRCRVSGWRLARWRGIGHPL